MTPADKAIVESYIIIVETFKVLTHDMKLIDEHVKTQYLFTRDPEGILFQWQSKLEKERKAAERDMRMKGIGKPKRVEGLNYTVQVRGGWYPVEMPDLKKRCTEKLEEYKKTSGKNTSG